MGRKVNVVLPSGRIVSVDEDVAKAGHLSTDTTVQVGHQEAERGNEERSSGIVEGLKATAEGAADTLTFGAYGAARQEFDPEGARTMRIRAQERPGMRFLGEAAALAAPGLGEAGVLGRAGRAAEFTAPGIARGVGEAIGGRTGQFAEGAILGVGGYISSTNVTGDPLTIEAAVESAGIGGFLNLGMNIAANKLEGAVWNNKLADAKDDLLKADVETGVKAKAAFKDTPPSWNEFVELHNARRKATNKLNNEILKEQRQYEDFLNNNEKLTDAITSTQKAVNTVRNDIYAKQGGPFGGTPERVKYQFDQTGKATGAEYKYESAKAQFGFGSDEGGQRVIVGPNGERVTTSGTPYVKSMVLDTDGRPIISDETLARLKDYDKRISRILKLKSGHYELDVSGKWVRNEAIPPNPKQALEELRQLQREIKGRYSQTSGVMDDVDARAPVPRQTVPSVNGSLPKSLEDFSRKHADQVNELAQQLDPDSARALERVMADLDLKSTPNPAENLTALHGTLREYRSTLGKLEAQMAKQAAEEAKKPMLLKLLNRAARYAAARTVDVGGAMGAIKRTITGELTGRALTKIEDNVLGASLLESRNGLRGRIRTLVTKYGVPTAGAARKLGSPLAYLATSFPSGEKDPESDYRRQAVNRINEIHGAALVAPDAAFMAVQGMLGAPDDIAWKMHQHVVGSLNYLVSTLPRDPGTDTKMFSSNWTPSYHEAIALAHRLEAVNDPVTAIARAIAGDSHPAATEALWAVYPAMMNELAQEISVAAPNLKSLTYEQASAYSILFRTPLTGLQQPVVVTALQGIYMGTPQTAAPPPGSGGGARSKKAVGRPPAVQSPVAGSSVANLTRS